jgi:hypothetical protein
MQHLRADADILTSARMASGMTRARADSSLPSSLGSGSSRRIGYTTNPAPALGFFVHGPANSSSDDRDP